MTELPRMLSEPGPLAVMTRSLVKRFGRTTALDGVDLTVPEGAVYVLVGPNGAGKTTTLKILLDLVVADAGAAEVLGLDTHVHGPRVRAQIGYVPEGEDDVTYGWLRAGALMRYHAAYYPSWDAAYATELARLFEIRPDAKFGELSKGQRRRVQLLMALAHCPPLLVLDEPTDGLDPLMRDQTLSALADHLARFPATILVSTHLVHEAERLSDHLGVMRNGRIDAQLRRDTLHRYMRRYRFQVPENWAGAPALADAVIASNGSQREAAWTIWGHEPEVAERLRAAGVTIRGIEPLRLEEATLTLLSRQAAPAMVQRGASRATHLAGV